MNILNAFEVAGGNYRQMEEDLGISAKKIRKHLKRKFKRALTLIVEKIKREGRLVEEWNKEEKK